MEIQEPRDPWEKRELVALEQLVHREIPESGRQELQAQWATQELVIPEQQALAQPGHPDKSQSSMQQRAWWTVWSPKTPSTPGG